MTAVCPFMISGDAAIVTARRALACRSQEFVYRTLISTVHRHNYRHDSRQKGHVVLGESDAVGDKRIRDMGGLLGSESTWFQLSYEKISS